MENLQDNQMYAPGQEDYSGGDELDYFVSPREMEREALGYDGSHEYTRLIDAQRARQQAVYDSMLMANRIQRLKLEEEKAAKRINETRARADEIVQLKQRNERIRLEKERRKAEEEKARILAVQRNRQNKAETQMSIRNKKTILQQEKIDAVQHVRQMRELNREQMEQQRIADVQRVARSAAAVRQQERSVLQKKKGKHQGSMEFDNGCSEYDRKMRKEDEIRSQAEAELLNMEREEAELISRLKRAQEAQASAFSQLEAALIADVAFDDDVEPGGVTISTAAQH